MGWGSSKINPGWVHEVLCNASASDLDTDALIECALFDNTPTPSQTDTVAHNCYAAGGGQWAAGGVVDTGTGAPAGWPALGRPMTWGVATRVSAATVATLTFDSDDVVSASATTTLAANYGTLVYDHTAGTPTDQALCWLYFGGAQSVTLGTYTIAFNGSGVLTIAF